MLLDIIHNPTYTLTHTHIHTHTHTHIYTYIYIREIEKERERGGVRQTDRLKEIEIIEHLLLLLIWTFYYFFLNKSSSAQYCFQTFLHSVNLALSHFSVNIFRFPPLSLSLSLSLTFLLCDLFFSHSFSFSICLLLSRSLWGAPIAWCLTRRTVESYQASSNYSRAIIFIFGQKPLEKVVNPHSPQLWVVYCHYYSCTMMSLELNNPRSLMYH